MPFWFSHVPDMSLLTILDHNDATGSVSSVPCHDRLPVLLIKVARGEITSISGCLTVCKSHIYVSLPTNCCLAGISL